jgi:hypothetical protein
MESRPTGDRGGAPSVLVSLIIGRGRDLLHLFALGAAMLTGAYQP